MKSEKDNMFMGIKLKDMTPSEQSAAYTVSMGGEKIEDAWKILKPLLDKKYN